jgi:hypothetical protein
MFHIEGEFGLKSFGGLKTFEGFQNFDLLAYFGDGLCCKSVAASKGSLPKYFSFAFGWGPKIIFMHAYR